MAHPQPDDLFNILPHQPGLLGQPLLPPIPQQGGRSDNAFSRLLGVQQGPNEQSNRGNALIAAGASLADDPGSFVGGVGRAIGAGQAVGQGLDQQDQSVRLQTRMAELAAQGQLTPMFLQALATGDTDTAKTIGTFLNSARNASQNQSSNKLLQGAPGTQFLRTDPETGEVELVYEVPPKVPGYTPPALKQVRDPVTGIVTFEVPEPGDLVPIPQGQQQMGLFFDNLAGAHEQMLSLFKDRDYAAPTVLEGAFVNLNESILKDIFRGLTSQELQNYDLVTQSFLEFFLRPVTGARIAQEEVRRGQRLFIPLPNDKVPTVKLKLANQRRFLDAMARRAGRGVYIPQTFTATNGMTRNFIPLFPTNAAALDEVFGVGDAFAGFGAASLTEDEEISVEDAREESRRRFGLGRGQ